MISRILYPRLLKALESKQITAITGLRRVGKTTTLHYLYEHIESSNKIILDLEKMEYRQIFKEERYDNVKSALEIEGINFEEKAFIFLDEIQLANNSTSIIKYFYDHYNIKFIITGSSSFYMKGLFTESLAGRKQLFELWPLNFKEFLDFKGVNINLPEFSFEPTNPYLISKLSLLYNEYINFGGFPEVALLNDDKQKNNLLKDILDSYIKFDILFLLDFNKSDEIYKLIKLLSARVGSKVDYSKLAGISGINRHKIKDYLLFLENTFFIKLIKPFVTNTDREIALQTKIYFSDNGLLNSLANINSGAKIENSIANQLYIKGELNYYAKRSGQEIDFILDKSVAIEVKETPTAGNLKTLARRAKSIGIDKYTLCGINNNNGFNDFIFGGAIY